MAPRQSLLVLFISYAVKFVLNSISFVSLCLAGPLSRALSCKLQHKFNAAGAYKACRSLLERTRVRESVLATKRSRALFRQLVSQVKRDTGGT